MVSSDAQVLMVDGPHGAREVRVSSPSRVLWPDPGITKLDLAQYFIEVGEAFVRANGDRPVLLQRFSGGIDGEQFFSKNPRRGLPTMCGPFPWSTRAGARIRSS